MIRPMIDSDWGSVREIYLEGIKTGIATFQTTAPSWEEWDSQHIKACRLVSLNETEEVIGWAALSLVSGRPVYRGVAEVSLYIRDGNRGNGVGRALMKELIRESEENGFWTLQSGVFASNEGSIALHLKTGFRQVGFREKIGRTESGIWQDTILFEHRSKTVGIDA